MATSYPAVGDDGDVDDAQHVDVHAIGDGIVEDFHTGGVAGATMTLNNTTNEATISDHRCRVAGYVGKSEGPVTLSVPAVGSTTEYTIAWRYDPALNVAEGGGGRSALGPARLQVFTGTLDTSGGKRYTILYHITRSASQVLTAATLADRRRWAGSAMTTQTFVAPVVQLPRGTQIFETSTGSTYLCDVNAAGTALEWRNLTAPAAVAFPLASGLVAYVSTTPVQMFKFAGSMVGLRGVIRRSNGANLGTGAAVTLGTVPAGWRPSTDLGFATLSIGNTGGIARIGVSTAGVVTLAVSTENQSAVVRAQLDGIIYRAGS